MVNYTCLNCERVFKQKGHFDKHSQRKTPCKKDAGIESAVNNVIKKLDIGLFQSRSYAEVKFHFDSVLNKDKSTFTSSNDEPTPIGCIEEILSSIPKTFWAKEYLKILDPCCGNGNFHLVVGNLLRENGHTYESAISAMEFNDLNPVRLQNVKEVFGATCNRTQHDFLKQDFGIDNDMIVMNPPYASLMEDGKRASKNHGLYISFMQKGLDSLKEGGYLVAIVPDSWMSLADRNKFCNNITSYQFVRLDIHTPKKWFPKVGSSFTALVVEKKVAYKEFTVSHLYKSKVYESIVNSSTQSYIPLWHSKLTQIIFDKTINTGFEKYKIETSSDLHKYTKKNEINDTEDGEFIYRLIHTPKQTVWAKRPHKFQEGWKVFLSTTDKYRAFIDCCGMTQSIAFIRAKNEEDARNVKLMLGHPLYVFLNNSCRYGNFNNIRILQKFPVAYEDPYIQFGITKEEQEYIESRV